MARTQAPHAAVHDATEEQRLRIARTLAHWLDSVIPLPGGYRIGLDGIIGLIPGAGDAVGAVLSSYIIALAARLGVPTTILMRMVGNALLDAVVGVIPILGDIFDLAYKANRRNLALLEMHAGRATPGKAGDRRLWGIVVVLSAIALLALVGIAYGLIALVVELFNGG